MAVTGASGYIGGRLIERLGGQGARKGRPYVLATDVREPRADWGDNVEFVQRDIRHPLGDLLSSRRIDAVAHLAFILEPDRRGETSHRVNVGGTANVITACEDAGVSHIVYLSSSSVYGARADNPDWLTEDAPPRPLRGFTYSEHKLAAERLLVEFAARSASATVSIVRACPVMGPNADNFIANAFRKPVLPILAGADPPMQLIHEDDMVETLIRCLHSKPSGIYNAAGDGAIRWERDGGCGRSSNRAPASLRVARAGTGGMGAEDPERLAGGRAGFHQVQVDSERGQDQAGVGTTYALYFARGVGKPRSFHA